MNKTRKTKKPRTLKIAMDGRSVDLAGITMAPVIGGGEAPFVMVRSGMTARSDIVRKLSAWLAKAAQYMDEQK